MITIRNKTYLPHDAFIEDEFMKGSWVGYHVDYVFRRRPKSDTETTLRRQEDMEWFFREFEQRLIGASAVLDLNKPRVFLIAAPGLPIPRTADSPIEAKCLVYRGILLIPRRLYLGNPAIVQDVQNNQELYLRPKGDLKRIKVQSALRSAGKVVGELLQARRNNLAFSPNTILLPVAKRMVQAYHPSNWLILAYDKWFRKILEGREWRGYLLTFMFNHLGGSRAAALAQMQQEIDWFYGRLLTRIHRRPRSAGAKPWLPKLVAAPDMPVLKRWGKLSVDDITINDGLHYHAILLVPTSTRLDHGVDVEVSENKESYLGRYGKLRHIDVRPIVDTESDVFGYALKHIGHDPVSVDDILIMPKAQSELIHKSDLKRG